jgi:hypothetical protein
LYFAIAFVASSTRFSWNIKLFHDGAVSLMKSQKATVGFPPNVVVIMLEFVAFFHLALESSASMSAGRCLSSVTVDSTMFSTAGLFIDSRSRPNSAETIIYIYIA